jgi:methionyl-tRNA formyltransferase
MKSTVLLGKGELAIRIAEWFAQSPEHDLTAVVPVVPEPTWTASLRDWATAHEVPVVDSGDFRDLLVDGWAADLALSVFYSRIVTADFIERCGRILNLHNSPLPRYRGVSPINWALKNGEHEHGVTIHEMTPRIDDGPIVGQVKYSVYPEVDEVEDVLRRSVEWGWQLFQLTLPLLDSIVAREQDEAQATYYSRADDARLGDRRSFTRAESQAS